MNSTPTTTPSAAQLVKQARAAHRKLKRILDRHVEGDTTDLDTITKAETVRDSLPPLSYLPPAQVARLAFILGRLQSETGADLTPIWDSRVPGPLATVTRVAAERVLDSTEDLSSLAGIVRCSCDPNDPGHAYPPPTKEPDPDGDDDTESHRCDPLAARHLRAELAGDDPDDLPPLPDQDEGQEDAEA